MSETETHNSGQEFDEPTSSDVHVDGPMGSTGPVAALNKMRARLKGKMRHGRALTADDIDEAHKHAKLHAMASKASEDEDAEPFAFAELKPFAEPPAWIQYFPTPGTYTHPSYGKVDLSKERIANFVQNFNSGVYQKHIPIDAEHQTKLSGAVGYIKEMRVASDGSAEARVEWTDRGEKLIRADRMKSFSPEWYDDWTDPVDEQVYRDVAIGGALTTRPFFKERALRPLAASEAGAIVWADDGAADELTPPTRQGETHMAEDTKAASVAMTEEQIEKRFAELASKHATELEAVRKAAEETATKLAAEVETERTARQAAEQDARIKRFTDEVRGRSDANGAPWIGDVKAKVATLDHLAKTAGEDSDVFKSYVADQRAVAAQIKDSSLFKSFGSDAAGDGGTSAKAQIDAKAKAYAEEKGVTFYEAWDAVTQANPKLYAELRTEGRN